MRFKKRIPTILGITVIVFSLLTTGFLFKTVRNYLGHSSPDVTPREVRITNLTESGFSVSWLTSALVMGRINFGENSSLGTIALDDRDQTSGHTGQSATHHVTLRYLKPSSKYYFKIISQEKSFDNNGQDYAVTTAPTITVNPSAANPAYGTVQKADSAPAEGSILYFNPAGSTPLSALVKSSGNWLISLNNARTADLADYAQFGGTEKIEIFVQGGEDGVASAKTTIEKTSPVAQIILGKNYDFTRETTSPKTASNFTVPSVATAGPSLIAPASDSAVPSEYPIFKGTGVPDQTVEIKVESETLLTATVRIDQNGNWNWTPPTSLAPGEHTVTIKVSDKNGNPLELVRRFIVLASGSQVAEAATPSASPTASPAPTAIPTPAPTSVATASTAPASGTMTPTIILFIAGLALFILGAGRLLLVDK